MSAQPQNNDGANSAPPPATRVANPFASEPIAAAPTGAAAQALVQREVAEVQAAMVIAKRFPRNPVEAMDRILNECTRVGLAEKAQYSFARGGQDIAGPSIRLAEVLGRGWGNMSAGITELSRTNGVSECLAYAWDLETNFRDEKRFQVKHWRDTRQGGYAIKDERDIYELIANQGARRKRACILAIIPGDVQEAAMKQCDVTLHTQIQLTPERIKSMVEKFAAEFNVTQEMVEKRIQRRVDAITPALFVNLGKVFNSLKDGMSQPGDWFESVPNAPAGDEAPPATRTDSVKEKLRNRGKSAATDAGAERPKGEPLPGFDEAKAVTLLRGSTGAKQLDDNMKGVLAVLNGAATPLPIDAAYNEMREKFGEKA